MRAVLFTYCLIFLGFAPLSATADPLKILYSERPPYYVKKEDGTIGGLVSGPVYHILNQVGIETEWLVTSSKRQLETIRHNRAAVCSPGWFKKPDREVFAKFSLPIYQDKPQVIIMRPADHRLLKHTKVSDLIADPKYRIGVKLGYSYGPFFDDLLTKHSPKTISTAQNLDGMAKMLQGRRFDYFITTPEEFQVLFSTDEVASSGMIDVEFDDIPPGNKRYLICSKSVPDETIEAFNRALVELRP